MLYDNVYDPEKYKVEEISAYIEHPVPIRPPTEKESTPINMYLTKEEQAKMRRSARRERERQKQEEVILGLAPPPKPKVKLSNLMRVLGAESTADPTLIEQEVKRQTAERVASHEARNQANKLTREQKIEKRQRQIANEYKKGVFVAAFRFELQVEVD